SGGGEVIATSSSVIARTGEAAPGTGGAEFSGFSRPVLNNAGEVAFRGTLTGSGVTGANNEGLFTSSGLVVREGDAAPGTGGAVFAGFGAPSLNDMGEILFGAGLAGPGVTGANNSALFLWDGIRAPSLLLREGSVLDLGGGDQRTVNRLEITSNAFNNDREVVFTAGFTDASQGIFVLEAEAPGPGPTPVPLPASGWLLLAGLGALGALRRRA
ncbi:MAG: choice-of-anchor tandem repeat NxxGxxAF-containing protein, partial [Pseudomonadota bacterium]